MKENAEMKFRQRLLAGQILIGTMLKTPACQPTEIIADVGFDFVVVDQEHSPFDRSTTDLVLLAGRATGVPVLVRVPGIEMALAACDGGAHGIIVPHVVNSEQARNAVASCRYSGGHRGYATSTRAGRYASVPMARHVSESDTQTTVILQIEDPAGVHETDSIAAIEGVDGVFIGRNDLACAFGEDSVDSPSVRNAVADIADGARAQKKAIGVFVSNVSEMEWLKKMGATLFIFSSDQGFLRMGAARCLAEARSTASAE
jgi:staphyloferrin B biosynthesis citrate synthase